MLIVYDAVGAIAIVHDIARAVAADNRETACFELPIQAAAAP